MQKRLSKYFWDGDQNLSGEFKLKRILEYASFPDLIHYPFEELKKYFNTIDLNRLRTSEKRKQFLNSIQPYLKDAHDWDDLFDNWIGDKWRKMDESIINDN
jgi:hypothetical protein